MPKHSLDDSGLMNFRFHPLAQHRAENFGAIHTPFLAAPCEYQRIDELHHVGIHINPKLHYVTHHAYSKEKTPRPEGRGKDSPHARRRFARGVGESETRGTWSGGGFVGNAKGGQRMPSLLVAGTADGCNVQRLAVVTVVVLCRGSGTVLAGQFLGIFQIPTKPSAPDGNHCPLAQSMPNLRARLAGVPA